MTGDGVRFFSFLAVYVGNYVETDKNASESVLDVLFYKLMLLYLLLELFAILLIFYIFYVFFGRIRARAACGVCL